MHSDCFFFTGKSHNICEDYSRCGSYNIYQNYAIISDGCSSSLDTDIGARILVCTAEQKIEHLSTGSLPFEDIIKKADIVRGQFPGVYQNCLDATLLISYTDDPNTIGFLVAGDGFVVLIDNNDHYHIYDIEFPSGAPKYLSYQLNSQREQGYIQKFGNEFIVRYLFNDNLDKKEYSKYLENKETGLYWSKELNKNEYKAAFIMSDGVKSFTTKNITENSKYNSQVSYHDVLKELLSFKGYQGEFIKRRAKRFIKDMQKLGWENYDDVSIAGIYLGE